MREGVVDVVVVVQGEADLLQVVDALRPPGRLARRLDGGQEQGDQHGDDGDDDQQLDQREAAAANSHRERSSRALGPDDTEGRGRTKRTDCAGGVLVPIRNRREAKQLIDSANRF